MSDLAMPVAPVAGSAPLRGHLMVCAADAGPKLGHAVAALRLAGVSEVSVAVPSHSGDTPGLTAGDGSAIPVRTFDLPPQENALLPWSTQPEALRGILGVAAESGAAGCLLLGSSYRSLTADDLRPFAHGLLERNCAAVLPLYALRPTEGLLNTAILYPLTRALYGRQVRYPLAGDVGVSTELLRRAVGTAAGGARERTTILSIEAASANLTVCEARVSTRPLQQAEGRDLPAILEGVAGALFADMELKAPLWQRVRGSQELEIFGTQHPADAVPEQAPDTTRMVKDFELAARNLIEEWGLVMPPTSQVAVKRLSRAPAGEFVFPDALWARVVYDFALAHRTRTISRNHLFGAFTPLYLAWVASFLSQPAATARNRIEQMCRAFEVEKPYLLQRWRWPDRFTP